jgi:glycosyltransferase involved in cell wall biosynthesis
MNILVNAISARLGGGQTYVANLLARIPVGENLRVFLLAPENLNLTAMPENFTKLIVPEYLVTNLVRRTLWEKFSLPKVLVEQKIDVLFCPGGLINVKVPKTCKTVVTFQNMLPFDDDQLKKYGFTFSRFRNQLLRKKMLKSMKKADLVIFISQYAMQYISELVGNSFKKTAIIPHGIDPSFRKDREDQLLRPSWLPKENYLLYVSAIDVYKAQAEVVRAYAILKSFRTDVPKLILVGSLLNKPYVGKVLGLISELELSDEAIVKGHVDYRELPALYQNAKINIFASETENCPFILLEAMAAGRPLLVSERQPMPEFGGDTVIYFDPSSPDDLAEKLNYMLDDEKMMMRCSELSLEKSFQYDWNVSATKTWQSIISLV